MRSGSPACFVIMKERRDCDNPTRLSKMVKESSSPAERDRDYRPSGGLCLSVQLLTVQEVRTVREAVGKLV